MVQTVKCSVVKDGTVNFTFFDAQLIFQIFFGKVKGCVQKSPKWHVGRFSDFSRNMLDSLCTIIWQNILFQNSLVYTVKDDSFTQIYSRENYSTFAAKKVTAHAVIDVIIVLQCIQPSSVSSAILLLCFEEVWYLERYLGCRISFVKRPSLWWNTESLRTLPSSFHGRVNWHLSLTRRHSEKQCSRCQIECSQLDNFDKHARIWFKSAPNMEQVSSCCFRVLQFAWRNLLNRRWTFLDGSRKGRCHYSSGEALRDQLHYGCKVHNTSAWFLLGKIFSFQLSEMSRPKSRGLKIDVTCFPSNIQSEVLISGVNA